MSVTSQMHDTANRNLAKIRQAKHACYTGTLDMHSMYKPPAVKRTTYAAKAAQHATAGNNRGPKGTQAPETLS